MFTYADFKKPKKYKQLLQGLNLIPHDDICYTYYTLGRRVKNNLLVKLSNGELFKAGNMACKEKLIIKFLKKSLNLPELCSRGYSFRK